MKHDITDIAFSVIDFDAANVEGHWPCLYKEVHYLRIFYVIEGGQAWYKEENSKTKVWFKKGYIYILPVGKSYELDYIESAPIEIAYIHVVLENIAIKNELIEIDASEKTVYHGICKLLLYFMRQGFYDNAGIHSTVESLMLILNREYGVVTKNESWVNEIITYISSHLGDKLTNKELAELIDYDEKYLCRAFHKSAGITLHQYVISCKMCKAKHLLEKGYRINEISETIGFEEAKSFSNAFKNLFGITPSEYRKRYYKSQMIQPVV